MDNIFIAYATAKESQIQLLFEILFSQAVTFESDLSKKAE